MFAIQPAWEFLYIINCLVVGECIVGWEVCTYRAMANLYLLISFFSFLCVLDIGSWKAWIFQFLFKNFDGFTAVLVVALGRIEPELLEGNVLEFLIFWFVIPDTLPNLLELLTYEMLLNRKMNDKIVRCLLY